MMRQPQHFTELVEQRIDAFHDKTLFTLLGQNETVTWKYGELAVSAKALACQLAAQGEADDRVLILCPAGMDYIRAFFACLYSGKIAVPAYPPRNEKQTNRLVPILRDSGATWVLTTSSLQPKLAALSAQFPALAKLRVVCVDQFDAALADQWTMPRLSKDSLSFLQYTSGSTGTPKGVMVSHGNLLANEAMIQNAFQSNEDSVIVSWLPLFHDMGLMGMLQVLYAGATGVTLSPTRFITAPHSWLQAISDYRGTVSGGPNFAYELCVSKISEEQAQGLDLSTWRTAYSGAEPVRAQTLQRFAERFGANGFQHKAFFPCYGLAEATLLVSGGPPQDSDFVARFSERGLEQQQIEAVGPDEAGNDLVGCGQIAVDSAVKIMDPDSGQAAAENQVGEIWVGGDHVAHGYWRNDEASAATFVTDEDGNRFLRTGDLGFLWKNRLYITARLKDLVIIRGANYAPQDIEYTVGQAHEQLIVDAAAAFTIEEAGETRLIVVQEVQKGWRAAEEIAIQDAVRTAVSAAHGLDLHELCLVKRNSLLRTTSGKVRRRNTKADYEMGRLNRVDQHPTATPETSADPVPNKPEAVTYLMQADPAERRDLLAAFLLETLARLTGKPMFSLSRTRPITAFGLDSLKVAELRRELEKHLQVTLDFADLFEGPTVDDLAGVLLDSLNQPAASNVQPAPVVGESTALSPGQQALWFLYQLEPDNAAYHECFSAQLTPAADAAALEKAVRDVAKRHPLLGCTFREQDGTAHAVWQDEPRHRFEVVAAQTQNPNELETALAAQFNRGFDLANEAAMRVSLYQQGDHNTLQITVHHLAIDQWSFNLLLEELFQLYHHYHEGCSLSLPTPTHFAHTLEAQRQLLTGPRAAEVREYWAEALADPPPALDLPHDHSRPARPTFKGEHHFFNLDTATTDALKKLAAEQGTTLFQLLLSAYQVLMYRYTGQNDLIVGTPLSGRTSSQQERAMGYLVNVAPIRAQCEADTPFTEFLQVTRQKVEKALVYQDFPMTWVGDQIGLTRDRALANLFQTTFLFYKQEDAVQNAGGGFLLGRGGSQVNFADFHMVSQSFPRNTAQFDISLSSVENKGRLEMVFEANTDLFHSATVTDMAEAFTTLLGSIAATPSQTLSRLPLLSKERRAQVIAASGSTHQVAADAPFLSTVIEQQISQQPHAPAARGGGLTLSYAQLGEQAEQVRRLLAQQKVTRGTLVGLFFEREPAVLSSMLGVLQSGAAFLPLSPEYPASRLSYMVENAEVDLILTRQALIDTLPAALRERCVAVDADYGELAPAPAVALNADDRVYVMYTSGSTGNPKGISVNREALRLVAHGWLEGHGWRNENQQPCLRGNYLQVASISFDAFIADFARALMHGGTLVFCDRDVLLDAELFYQTMRTEDIHVIDLVPSLLRNLLDYLEATHNRLDFLKLVVVGSDKWFMGEYRRLKALVGSTTRVINNYGVTEATVDHVGFDGECPELADNRIVPIGRPYPNVTALVLDRHLEPVPTGVRGELCLTGPALSNGYFNSPESTAFCSWNGTGTAQRMFRTGDLARYRHDGLLSYFGRGDDQMKIRGARVEPGEIEAVLVGFDTVDRAAVLLREDQPGRPYLAAYATTRGARPERHELDRYLRTHLVTAMIPAVVTYLDEMPLTPNGKIDRRLLATIVPAPDESREVVAPRNETEAALVAIWKDVLGREDLGIHDDFFDMGGHSLLATQIISRVADRFGSQVPIRALFESATPAVFAQRLQAYPSRSRILERYDLVKGMAKGENRPSFAQSRLWFLDQLEPGSHFYNMIAGIHLHGPLDAEALAKALRDMVARHEPLRTNFIAVEGEPKLQVAEVWQDELKRVDLRDLPNAEREETLHRLAAAEEATPFQLDSDPLFRATLIQTDETEHTLLVCVHHIVSDGWSTRIMFREINDLYQAHRDGTALDLAEPSVSYSDYAYWQQEWLSQAGADEPRDYWVKQLAGVPTALQLPTDHPRPKQQTYVGRTNHYRIPPALVNRMRGLARDEQATLYIAMLAAFKVLLYRYTGQNDIVVGTPFAGRNHSSLENLIGYFVNTLPLRDEVNGTMSFRDLVTRVKRTLSEAHQHQNLPFERIVDEVVEERDLSVSPIFQVVFVLENEPFAAPAPVGLTSDPLALENTIAKFDLTLFLVEEEDGLNAALEFNTHLFENDTIDRLFQHYTTVLNAVAASPDQPLSGFSLLTAAEKQTMLFDWNQTEAPLPQGFAHQIIEQRSARHPEAIAAVWGDRTLDYGTLNRNANRLAHALLAAGLEPNSAVMLLGDRSFEYLTAILAVYKAGAGYVPLNPDNPTARHQSIIDQIDGSWLLVTQPFAQPVRDELGLEPMVIEDLLAQAGGDESNPPNRQTATSLANIFFTSGSTGKPKGAMIEQLGMLNHLWAKTVDLGYGENEVVAQNASQSFDISVWQFLTPLLHGGSTLIVDDEIARNPEALPDEVDRHGVTVFETVPSMLRSMLDIIEKQSAARRPTFAKLRWLISNAEALTPDLVHRWFALYPQIPMINTYGATECSDDISHLHITAPPQTDMPYMPLGRRLINIRLYIVDDFMNPVPVGLPGEICIAGLSVGRGYLKDAERTGRAFISDPFHEGEHRRLYRTGDIGRYTRDGDIEFLGRKDHQLKIRGYRVELEEITFWIGKFPAVEQHLVTSWYDDNHQNHLVAYLREKENHSLDQAALRAFLLEHLPDYMVPEIMIPLTTFPLNANGKIDRKQLPSPADHLQNRTSEGLPPRTPVESVVAAVYAQVLNRTRISRDDHFFQIGGHSLTATQAVARLRDRLSVELPLRTLFQKPIVAELARELDHLRRDEPARLPMIASEADTDTLSFAQQRMWFLDQFEPNHAFYNVPALVTLRGELDIDVLCRSLALVIERHDNLRTLFPEVDGRPQRVVHAALNPRLEMIDLSNEHDPKAAAEAMARDEAVAPFNLADGPLLRTRLLRLAADHHVLLLNMHHIITDGWSEGVLMHELSTAYNALRKGQPVPLAPLSLHYGDYAAWQRRMLDEGRWATQMDYWRETLAGNLPTLDFPLDKTRPSVTRHQGRTLNLTLSGHLSNAVRELAKRENATLFMALLGAYSVALHRSTNQREFVIGSPVAGRDREETEQLIGFFVNTLCLRIQVDPAVGFGDLLRHVVGQTLGAYSNPDIPFEKLVETLAPNRDSSRNPLFQAMFVLQNAPFGEPQLDGLEVAVDSLDTQTSLCDVLMAVEERDAELHVSLRYDSDLFEEHSMQAFLERFQMVLEQLTAAPNRPVGDLPLLSQQEYADLDRWSRNTAPTPLEATAHALFSAGAAASPQKVALVGDNGRMTYEELEADANRIAHLLLQNGVRPGDHVGLYLERSFTQIAALFGILKAGAAYVPLDTFAPKERLAYIAADTAVPVILSTSDLPPLATENARTLYLDREATTLADLPSSHPARPLSADFPCLVLYTSGSTGKPKGIRHTHRTMVNYIWNCVQRYGIGPDSRTLYQTTIGFDLIMVEVFPALFMGGTVFVPKADGQQDPAYITDFVRRHKIHLAAFVPALLDMFLKHAGEEDYPHFNRAVVAGEVLPKQLSVDFIKRFGAQLYNLYGPSEIFGCSAYPCRVDEHRPSIPIGTVHNNYEVYILDEQGAQTPPGVFGEMHIGGESVSLGYVDQPRQTAGVFVPNPFSPKAGARMYRSGDIGRFLPNGLVEFAGRRDHQVKIRGVRIELGEIEYALQAFEAVDECVVVAVLDPQGHKQLIAYVVTKDGSQPENALRESLTAMLPKTFLPAYYSFLDALPRNANGKVDRLNLPPFSFTRTAEAARAPRNETETTLAAIWCDLLGLEQVGIDDEFFELGGHSLLATQLVSMIHQQLGVKLDLRALFVNTTIEAQAAFIAGRTDDTVVDLPQPKHLDRNQPLPLSFHQNRLWFLHQLHPDLQAYTIPTALDLHGSLDTLALSAALNDVVQRHEVLRTRIVEQDGVPALVHQNQEIPVAITDLGAVQADEQQDRVAAEIETLWRTPFDLDQGPLLCAHILRLNDEHHVALFAIHHIVFDGWSAHLLVKELGACYNARRNGTTPTLPALPFQFADIGAWQKQVLESEHGTQQLEYWLKQLGGDRPVTAFPADRPAPAVFDESGATQERQLDPTLAAAVQKLCHQHKATLFQVLLAAFNVMLHRHTGDRDMIVGSPVAGRNLPESENLIGFFVNNLVLRTQLDPGRSFTHYLEHVRQTTLDAYANQDVPFDQLVDALEVPRNLVSSPLFQIVFEVQNVPEERLSMDGLTVREMPFDIPFTEFDLGLLAVEDGDALTLRVQYATSRYDAATIEALLDRFQIVLGEVTANPDKAVAKVAVLPESERRLLLEDFAGAPTGTEQAEHPLRLFQQAAADYPDHPALVDNGKVWNYAQTAGMANRIANKLQSLGVGHESMVALMLDRSREAILTIIGISSSGAAYLPLNPELPPKRLAYMLEDSGTQILISDRTPAFALPDGVTLLSLDDVLNHEDERRPEVNLDPAFLSYLIYTSGSTGNPKGVAIENYAITDYIRWYNSVFTLGPDDRTMQSAGMGFDAMIEEIWPTISVGGAIHIVDNDTRVSPPLMADWLKKSKITSGYLATSMVSALMQEHRLTDLISGLIATGGEALPPFKNQGKDATLVNMYGPTEATVAATYAFVSGGGIPPIGKPIGTTQCYILDRNLELVPPGTPGEICLAGTGLARGYRNNPRETAKNFVPNPFGPAGSRLYRTGDLGRFDQAGDIYFLGRLDFQVSLRGHRIETGEIEANLRNHDAVFQAAVLPTTTARGDEHLIAYVVVRRGFDQDEAALRKHLAEYLPAYMVPTWFLFLDSLPLTNSGKLDRKALPEPPESEAAQCRNPLEELIAGIFADVLERPQVGPTDHFFTAGGHSLLAARLVAEVESATGQAVPLRVFFEEPTPRALADYLAAEGRTLTAMPRVARDGALPLSYAEEGIWFFQKVHPENTTFNLPVALRLVGDLDHGALEQALQAMVDRHEILRTVYPLQEGRPVRRIHSSQTVTLPLIDMIAAHESGAAARDAACERLIREECTQPFNLQEGPLMRGFVVRKDYGEHLLVLSMHHIISDGVAQSILVSELSELYRAALQNQSADLAPQNVQYADYAHHQRLSLEQGRLQTLLDFWLPQLEQRPALQVPTDRPRPAQRSGAGASLPFSLDRDVSAAVRNLGRAQHATLFMTLLTVWDLVLQRLSGQDHFVLGTPIANRGRRETENAQGCFVNQVPLPFSLTGDPDFTTLLAENRGRLLDIYAHQDMPYERLLKAVNQTGEEGGLFHVLFAVQNMDVPEFELPGLTISTLPLENTTSKYDLALYVWENGEQIEGELTYDTDLYDRATVADMISRFKALAERLCRTPDAPLSSISLLSQADRAGLSETEGAADLSEADLEAVLLQLGDDLPDFN